MNKQQIKQQIIQAIENDPFKKDIKKVSLFGSYLTSQQRENSDIDILIEFQPKAAIGFFKLAKIKRNLESFVKKQVDLLTPEALSKFFRADVINNAETIYEG
ncbi:nucleotidyltransferase domain-containing protein [Patescibacteria group bacterium]|nr:nucleotidyltransferase [Candidatus Falkowbacteria bacterium]MBU3906352.1 nucleotidyltransferase domain-containing protein [Patescibacteria group bacterium]MCG2698121.1 nucleotidyltransferase domain-containing protein [Candidatus Parcubacteria bacterium]MBU4014633.1 nucleotidyltransferase domain-containing protein [Patescibacteria group bacterium]MBU4026725.1 nucleotidyltransferase domain-containing protein [Patescibacteria group bacterium]